MHARRGITLLELLVAAGVFISGFVLVFGLFLAGMKYRKAADDTAKLSAAASSLVAELRIDAGREANGPHAPSDYVGDGLAGNAVEAAGELTRFASHPGVWYRVTECTDVKGADDPTTTALRMRIFVLSWPQAGVSPTLSLGAVGSDLPSLRGAANPTDQQVIDACVSGGFAWHFWTVILRSPSWAN